MRNSWSVAETVPFCLSVVKSYNCTKASNFGVHGGPPRAPRGTRHTLKIRARDILDIIIEFKRASTRALSREKERESPHSLPNAKVLLLLLLCVSGECERVGRKLE